MGQPAHLKEQKKLSLESTHLANQITRPRTCCNLPPTGKNELAGEALIKGSGAFTLIPAVFRISTPTPIQDLAPAPGQLSRYMDEELQRTTKLALESFI